MNKVRIVYVPGFGGNEERSTTYKAIKETFGENHEVVCLKYDNIDPVKAEQELSEQLYKNFQENSEIVLVGNSLGGYWANHLCEKFDYPTILINPSYNPAINLKKRQVPHEICVQFTPITLTKGLNKEIFIGGLDDIVDPKILRKTIGDIYPVHYYPNEGHRFENKTPILELLKTKINTYGDYINVD